jgi:hypothetical protein
VELAPEHLPERVVAARLEALRVLAVHSLGISFITLVITLVITRQHWRRRIPWRRMLGCRLYSQ